MKVLVTGGTGVVGRAAITALLRRGHEVRLLSRGAEADVASWEGAVEPFAADVADAARVAGAADGCAAVLHVVGIVEEAPPDVTFERINIGGARNLVKEAERARVRRFVYVSSLGADRGASDYHRSKFAGEQIVSGYDGNWTIARIAPVVGPRDETVSVLLRMVRSLPVVPVIGSGDQPFQPIWHEDAGAVLAECVEREDLTDTVLRLAGIEVITVRDALDTFEDLTGRSPLHLPFPAFLARVGSSLAEALGLDMPVSAATVQMLLEGSYLRDGEANDLVERFGHSPEPIRKRLAQLADALPEQTPDKGVGKLKRCRFTIDIRHARFRATELLERFREKFAQLVPFEAAAEPGAPEHIDDGATLTLELPVRGHVQVRVERVDERSITLATIAGHPLAGVVHFEFADLDGDGVRFTIDVVERPASRLDQLSMALVGRLVQRRTWAVTAENVTREAGGEAPEGVIEKSCHLDDADAGSLVNWINELIRQRERRQEHQVGTAVGPSETGDTRSP
jgi:NADH dehydrogenase